MGGAGGGGPCPIFCPLFTNCIYWVNLGMGREGETPAQIFGTLPFKKSGTSYKLQEAKFRSFLWQILTFPDLPCQPDRIFKVWVACISVPYIVLHILCSTRTFWGLFSHSKVSWTLKAHLLHICYKVWIFSTMGFLRVDLSSDHWF